FDRTLRAICDPERTDADAKRDQQALIVAHGGTQKILARGGSSYTPIPGEAVNLLGNEAAP
ncbi:MAG: sulfatase, partial [Burkholderiales bacterium]|nr:sulfatase [Burkholderiales bacterium]